MREGRGVWCLGDTGVRNRAKLPRDDEKSQAPGPARDGSLPSRWILILEFPLRLANSWSRHWLSRETAEDKHIIKVSPPGLPEWTSWCLHKHQRPQIQWVVWTDASLWTNKTAVKTWVTVKRTWRNKNRLEVNPLKEAYKIRLFLAYIIDLICPCVLLRDFYTQHLAGLRDER